MAGQTAFVDNDFCFACGALNPAGLQLVFERDGDVLFTRFRPSQLHQGWRDVLHGGVQATVFDDLMSNCMFRIHGLGVVTAELTTRFRSPVPLDRELEFRAWLSGGKRPLWELSAECRIHGESGGRPLSTAKGRFMETPTEGR
ncbi:MAG: PaaI family thioesterase [Planctomycetales bacterium]|nr:PaaI family thioesterase [bacterium]UNM07953.1 MAG: PaaI family thioesterase [Planctomycetales bacterium]